ncbi:hypothetical protein L1887_14959 [Cichorium endivia]|nr:hypothetical protein L1887_14959 [Cichorium endivia]
MEPAELTVVIKNGKDLKDVKHLGTMDPYAVVWIAGCGKESEKVTTPVSQKRGCYPEWDYPIKFHIFPMKTDYSLFIQIKHDGTMFDRHIGEVEVPFADLLKPNASKGNVNYRLSRPSGKKKGEIILSHEFSKLVVNQDDGTGITNVTDPRGKKKFDKAKKAAKKVAKIGYIAAQITLSVILLQRRSPAFVKTHGVLLCAGKMRLWRCQDGDRRWCLNCGGDSDGGDFEWYLDGGDHEYYFG